LNQTVNYQIPDGWPTNLVTKYWLLDRKNERGQNLYGGEYWYQGSRRVLYSELTIESGNYTVPGVPDGRSHEDIAYKDARNNERHYWSSYPTNETTTYNTTFRVWGNFTTYVTHLSNHLETIACQTSGLCQGNVTTHSSGRFESSNIMQCPFQFRCFSPESAAGSPGCHQNFPDDYEHQHVDGNHPRKLFVGRKYQLDY
jgi:hypothetical protein